MKGIPILTLLTLTPLVGGFVVIALGSARRDRVRWLGMGVSLLALLEVIWVWGHFTASSAELQMVEWHAWAPALGVEYFLGIDGLGLLMLLLTALLVPLALAVSWHIEKRPSLYFGLVLWLEAGLFGTFTALNFFHWFLFWELSLIPAFFLVKLWGGPHRSAAATQFFLYTMVGSIAMLLAFLALFWATGTFDLIRLAHLGRSGRLAQVLGTELHWTGLSSSALAMLVFGGAFLGLAVKVPLFPFHTWLPTTYAEAPTGTTILLTGALSKMGVYGFLRILFPIFPVQMRQALTPLLILAVVSIIFSAAAAFTQRDLKRMLSYSSINHLGYCLLGIFAAAALTKPSLSWNAEKAAALNGVFLQMFNHGITAGALFGFLAFLERRSGGLRGLDDFGGLRRVMPVFCGLMGISLFASLGLPGLNGFVGEFLIFKGSLALAAWATVPAVLGLLFTAIFLLTLLQRVFNGPLAPRWQSCPDLSWKERLAVAPAVVIMCVLGLFPQCVLSFTNATVVHLVNQINLLSVAMN